MTWELQVQGSSIRLQTERKQEEIEQAQVYELALIDIAASGHTPGLNSAASSRSFDLGSWPREDAHVNQGTQNTTETMGSSHNKHSYGRL